VSAGETPVSAERVTGKEERRKKKEGRRKKEEKTTLPRGAEKSTAVSRKRKPQPASLL
jgi:hypothetical protein